MIVRTLRLSGALAILAVGAVHLQQYIGADYQSIPTIGPLFLLNAIAAAIVGIALLVPIKRLMAAPRADAATGILALAAVGIAIGSLVALFISESSSLFGFSESGYHAAVIAAIVAEAATIALLIPVAIVSLAHALSRGDEAAARRHGGPESRLDYRAARQT